MSVQEFRIASTSPSQDDLMFWCIAGYECLGCPSVYELRVLSHSDKLDARDVLGHAFDVSIGFDDIHGERHVRHAQGHAVRFVRMQKVGRFFQYHITLRSWFWLLSKRVNSRIFQMQTALEVLDVVTSSSSIQSVTKLSQEHVIVSHPVLRYCTQYQERDDHFLQRLLEDEGIYYWFDAHDEPSMMRLSDTSAVAHLPLPAESVLKQWGGSSGTQPRFNELYGLKSHHRTSSGAYASRDSDFKVINTRLQADRQDPNVHELADMEVFEFPGGYLHTDDRQVHAYIRMEELASNRELFDGRTNWADVSVGRTFEYQHDGSEETPEGEYLIAACVFCVRQPGYEGVDSAEQSAVLAQQFEPLMLQHVQGNPLFADRHAQDQNWLSLQVHDVIASGMQDQGRGNFGITALRAELPYRPARLLRRPVMPGPQSAIVVGPADEELYVDEYGRVKVQFHWDRYGQFDENSTCWVRVSQPWAGKTWGAYFMPRIGHEVIVDFLNGDPDRPIIMGRVYNDDQPKPYDSPTQSGIKTRSTPGGNASTFNELRFEDAIGREQIHLHAEKDLDVVVEKMETRKVGTNRYTKVGGVCQTSVGGKRTADVGKDDIVKVVQDQKINVGGEQGVTVVQKVDYAFHSLWRAAANAMDFKSETYYKLSAQNIKSVAIDNYRVFTSDYQLDATSKVQTAAPIIKSMASIAQHVTAGKLLKLGSREIELRGTQAIRLICGASSITITPASIELKSTNVNIEGTALAQMRALVVSINGEAQTRVVGGVLKMNA